MTRLRILCATTVTLLALGACSTTGQGPSAEGRQPMTAPELLKLLTSGQDFDLRSADGGAETLHFARDGTVTVVRDAGEASGRWRISADRYCVTWQEGTAGERCFHAYREGESVYALAGPDGVAAGTLSAHR
ncbi:MAG: hypothetical protein KDH15_03105 [Rhodocyclaceae bacterium]|nr:hypothetical protein [Rhodocyclaceae bacterium]